MTDEEMRDWMEHYIAELIAAARSMRLEQRLRFFYVYHDDWCDKINRKGSCNCRPDVKVFKVRTK
jgi:hypothetical protein